MTRAIALLLSFLTSLTLLSATAIAAPSASFYDATLAAPATVTKPVIHGSLWSCAGTSCAAAQGTSRPAIACAAVARELGRVTAFRAGGASLDEQALAKCNEKARGGDTRVARAN